MSYFAMACRVDLSATSFNILGNMCKILSVAVNLLVWNLHATPTGIALLAFALAGGALYEEAPTRQQNADMDAKTNAETEEKKKFQQDFELA